MSAQGTGRERPSRPSLPHSTTCAPTEVDGFFVRLMPLGPINDSVGKICTDKLTSAGTRQNPAFAAREAAYSSSACEEQGHETRGRSKDCCSFPLHMQVLLIVLGPSFAERRCTDMLTKFTNRVINRRWAR